MTTTPEKRAVARERALRMATKLALLADASSADVARLVVEPTLSWLGWSVLDPASVRRGVKVEDGASMANFVCRDRHGALMALWVTLDAKAVVKGDFFRWLGRFHDSPVPYAVQTDGRRWFAHRWDTASKKMVPMFECDLGDADALEALTLEQAMRPKAAPPPPAAPERPPLPPPVDGHRPTPDPRNDEAFTVPARTWDPTTYVPEVETWKKPRYVDIRGTRHHVSHWYEVVRLCAQHHLNAKGTLPKMLFPRQRFPYASRDSRELRRPEELKGGWYYEADLNANLAHRVATEWLRSAGVARGEALVTFA